MVVDDEERWVKRRANYIERTTDLRKVEATALAYSELGYSNAGIAQKPSLDTSKSTVKSWLERIASQYGIHTLNAKNKGEIDQAENLTEITSDDIEAYPREIREDWYVMAARNVEDVPDDPDGTTWINSKFQFDAQSIEYDNGEIDIK